MFDIALRKWKDGLTEPVARIVPSFITPGHITFAAFVCGLLCCYISTDVDKTSTGLFFWLANRFLDCLDGLVARQRKTASDLGGFLDLLSDFIIYSLLPVSIAWGQSSTDWGTSHDWVAIALLEASFHVNNFILFYSAAAAASRRDGELTSVTMRPALVEGFESGVLFTAMLAFPRYITPLSWLMTAGVVVGICQRTLAVASALGRGGKAQSKKAT